MLINKTEARVNALAQIKTETIYYDGLNAEYYETTEGSDTSMERISGARRRIFAELRAAGIVQVAAGSTQPKQVSLTQAGEDTAREWGID